MMPPVILGGDPAAAVLQADVQRALRRALVETGDLRLVDMAPVALGDLGAGLAGGGLLARLPEQVHLSVQVRVLADHSYLRVGIVLQNPADNALVWSDEVIVPRRESIGEASFAMPLIVRATEEATLHFLRRHGTEGAEAEGRIAAAVASMFRLARGDLDRSEEILRRHLDRTPTAQGYAWLAFLNTFRVGQRFNPADAPLIEETQHLARRALGLEPNNALVSALVGHIHSYLFGEFDYAAALFEQSLRVNPAQTLAWDLYAMLHAYAGQPKRALAMARWARHLAPSARIATISRPPARSPETSRAIIRRRSTPDSRRWPSGRTSTRCCGCWSRRTPISTGPRKRGCSSSGCCRSSRTSRSPRCGTRAIRASIPRAGGIFWMVS